MASDRGTVLVVAGLLRLLSYLELQEEEEVGEEESDERREHGAVEQEDPVERHPAGLGEQLDESSRLRLALRDGLGREDRSKIIFFFNM